MQTFKRHFPYFLNYCIFIRQRPSFISFILFIKETYTALSADHLQIKLQAIIQFRTVCRTTPWWHRSRDTWRSLTCAQMLRLLMTWLKLRVQLMFWITVHTEVSPCRHCSLALLHDVMMARHHRGNLAMCHSSPDTAHYRVIRVLSLNNSTNYVFFSLTSIVN